jgi:hypothetical protein
VSAGRSTVLSRARGSFGASSSVALAVVISKARKAVRTTEIATETIDESAEKHGDLKPA